MLPDIEPCSLSDLADLPVGRLTWTSPCGGVHIVLDDNEGEWFVEADPLTEPSVIEDALTRLVFPMGYELIDEDECEPEAQPSGRVRIYAVPVVPIEVAAGTPPDFSAGFMAVGGLLASAATFLAAHPYVSSLLEVVTL